MRSRETILRLAAVALLAYMLVSFATARSRFDAMKAEERELALRRAELSAANELLRSELDSLREDGTMEALARERLGLVMPGERIYYFD